MLQHKLDVPYRSWNKIPELLHSSQTVAASPGARIIVRCCFRGNPAIAYRVLQASAHNRVSCVTLLVTPLSCLLSLLSRLTVATAAAAMGMLLL
jgi:hypothetical protein